MARACLFQIQVCQLNWTVLCDLLMDVGKYKETQTTLLEQLSLKQKQTNLTANFFFCITCSCSFHSYWFEYLFRTHSRRHQLCLSLEHVCWTIDCHVPLRGPYEVSLFVYVFSGVVCWNYDLNTFLWGSHL